MNIKVRNLGILKQSGPTIRTFWENFLRIHPEEKLPDWGGYLKSVGILLLASAAASLSNAVPSDSRPPPFEGAQPNRPSYQPENNDCN
jgi:hypothetical protein